MENRITTLFGIRYPIIAGGMIWCSGWRLAAAVSDAGGLGLIGAGSMTPRPAARTHPQMPRGDWQTVRRERPPDVPLRGADHAGRHGRAGPGGIHLGGKPEDMDRATACRRLQGRARGVEHEIRPEMSGSGVSMRSSPRDSKRAGTTAARRRRRWRWFRRCARRLRFR